MDTTSILTEGDSEPGNGSIDIYSRIATQLSDLVPIRGIEVERDDVRQLLILMAEENSGIKLPARSLSDGTLRFLTLCILAEDSEADGLLCMEEPENGIHPAKISAMVSLLKDLVVDTNEVVGPENTIRQLIIATHSPYLVQLQNPSDVLLALYVSTRNKRGESVNTMRCKPLSRTWRCNDSEKGVGLATIVAYLSNPPGAQISLFGPEM